MVIEKDWERFKSILFLRNAESARFGDLLVDYRKEYANNIDKYPEDLQTMVDVMWQQPEKKCKPPTKPQPKKEEEKEKRDAASSFAQKEEDFACYCCGD